MFVEFLITVMGSKDFSHPHLNTVMELSNWFLIKRKKKLNRHGTGVILL